MAEPAAAPIIEVQDLTRRFGDFVAVDAVSFRVERGEIFGYLGANGAGKSTTIRMLCGLLAPTSGSARVAGFELPDQAVRVKSSIGYMSQRFSLYTDLEVAENLSFFAGAYGLRGARRRQRIDYALEVAGLTDRRRALTRDLPGGIRQRLALASALLHEPTLIFLDEPTAGVDPASRRSFWRLIRQLVREGTTVFVTTHHLDEAEYCGRVGLMVDGHLTALDTPAALKRTHVPGTMLAIGGDLSVPALRSALAGQDGVLDIQPFGRALHVRVRGPLSDPDAMARALERAGITGADITPTEPTLEDVFLTLAAGSTRQNEL
ncbi:MAG: ABC transporter ATP-binding protein [Deltaproteobacteria bacterium]|nr:ABC transporter ATP-binding protein [Deltaproteobacteria bacterium]